MYRTDGDYCLLCGCDDIAYARRHGRIVEARCNECGAATGIPKDDED